MRLRALTTAVLVLIIAAGLTLPARALSLVDLIAQCRSSGQSEASCRGLYAELRIEGQLCRDATANADACSVFDGVTINESLVAAQEGSWLNRALALQRGLDDAHPLQDELWVHTHNSFNADAYAPTFYGLDRNNIYSMTDQLRMGIRAIEIDAWYTPTLPNGDPASGFNALIACHGDDRAIGPIPLNALGCGVNDPLLIDDLREVKTWMDANPNEVLMLYIENNLPHTAAAQELAGKAIESTFGTKIYKTPTDCADLPMDTSRKQIHDSGARIIITGNCGATGTTWGKVVHVRGPRWIEGGLDYGDDFTPARCAADRVKDDYAHNWIRHYGDETGLSAGATVMGGQLGSGGDTTANDALNMTRCGVNMVGMDNLVPFDERVVATVWSWSTNEPSSDADGMCASLGTEGRFSAKDCSVSHETITTKKKHHKPKTVVVDHFTAQPFACYDGTNWHVTSTTDRWANGASVCAAEGLGSFSVPWNGYENERLKQAAGNGAHEIWLNYHAAGGSWLVGS